MCFLNAYYPWHYFPLLTCKGSPTFKISNILRLWPQAGTFLNWLLIVVDGKLGMDVSGEEKKVTRCRAPYWNPCRPSAGLQLQAWYHSKPFLTYKCLSECCSLKVGIITVCEYLLSQTLSSKQNGACHAQYGCLGEGKVLLIISYSLCG